MHVASIIFNYTNLERCITLKYEIFAQLGAPLFHCSFEVSDFRSGGHISGLLQKTPGVVRSVLELS